MSVSNWRLSWLDSQSPRAAPPSWHSAQVQSSALRGETEQALAQSRENNSFISTRLGGSQWGQADLGDILYRKLLSATYNTVLISAATPLHIRNCTPLHNSSFSSFTRSAQTRHIRAGSANIDWYVLESQPGARWPGERERSHARVITGTETDRAGW